MFLKLGGDDANHVTGATMKGLQHAPGRSCTCRAHAHVVLNRQDHDSAEDSASQITPRRQHTCSKLSSSSSRRKEAGRTACCRRLTHAAAPLAAPASKGCRTVRSSTGSDRTS